MRTNEMPGTTDRMIYCECCGRELDRAKVEWLELNSHTGRYSKNEGECPESESQGWFSFGVTCARKVLKEQTNE